MSLAENIRNRFWFAGVEVPNDDDIKRLEKLVIDAAALGLDGFEIVYYVIEERSRIEYKGLLDRLAFCQAIGGSNV